MGADIKIVNKNDENCLILAVRNKQAEMVKYLCDHCLKPKGELDVDYESKRNGLTAFARACLIEEFGIADNLLNEGKANKDHVSMANQKSIIELAMDHKLSATLHYLA